jgi:hypothetical protein
LGPLAVSFTRNGLGLAVDNDTSIRVVGSGSAGLDVRSSEQITVRAGYSLRIPLPEAWPVSLAVGLGLNAYVAGAAEATASLVTLPTMLNTLASSFFLAAPFELILGGAVDAGIMVTLGQSLAVGLSVDDIYAPTFVFPYDSVSGFFSRTATRGATEYTTAPLDLTLGLALTPRLGSAQRYVQDLTIAVDYRDILDFWLDAANADNVFLKFGIGAEATFLQVLSVRLGFDRGMIAAGLGLDLGMFDLSAAMYGTEVSAEPGVFGVYNLVLGLEFGR